MADTDVRPEPKINEPSDPGNKKPAEGGEGTDAGGQTTAAGETPDRLPAGNTDSSGGAGAGSEQAADEQASEPSSPQKASLGAKLWKRKGLVAVGALGSMFVIFFLILFLFINGFKLTHIRNLMIDYSFAQFHRGVAKRSATILAEEAIIRGEGSLSKLRGASIYEKMRLYNPERALQRLGKTSNFKMEFEGKEFKGFTDVDGKFVPKEDPNFKSRLSASVDEALEPKSKFFRSRTTKRLNDLAGIKRKWWKQNGEDYNAKTQEEIRKADAKESVENISENGETVKSNSDAVNEDVEEARKRAAAGDALEEIAEEIPQKMTARARVAQVTQTISGVVWITTMFCMFDEIFTTTIEKVMEMRTGGAMRLAAGTLVKADQQKKGDTTAPAVEASAKKFDGFEDTATGQRWMGNPVTKEDLAEEDQPSKFMGQDPSGMIKIWSNVKLGIASVLFPPASAGFAHIPGVSSLIKTGVDKAFDASCKVLLDPRVQIGIAVTEVVVAIFSAGTEEGLVQALKIAGTNLIKGVPRLLGETAAIIVVTDIIPKLVIQNAGLDISANQKVGPYTNKNGAGIDLYAHETARLHGATKIPAAAKAELDATVRAEKMEAAKKQSLAWRWFNLDNPNSLLARMVGTIPITPSRAIAKLDGQFAAIFSPIKLATTYGQTTLAITSGSYVYADDGVNPYGNQNYMWTDSQLETSPAENATYVLNKIDSDKDFKGKYDKCFNDSITKVTLHPDDYKHCDDDDAVKYGLYMFDTQTVENLASLTNDEDDEGLGGGGGGSSSGGGGTIVTGTSKELATQILQKSDRITFTTGEAKQEMTQIAAGQEIKVPCGSGTTSLNPVLLGALLAASDKYVIGIGYLANGCHSANSRHYTGDAVDINTLNGKQSDGLTQLDWDFLNYIGPMLPNGSGFGQSACGVAAHVKLSNVTVFADPCTHIHIQVPRS